ncbi:hypothetical protein HID58_015632 [Brassica napus]|uniref:Uncharacterized protein n=2 Tax=Brassica TaxID=3705 RepID=A0ABQ8DN53_BRANA|nr:hypothetical protein HID58_015632 [Brassica napus]
MRPKAQNEKPEEEGVDNLPTACTNAQHSVTRVKARINHLPPALQRRGDGLPPTAELKPMKKDAQTEPSSRPFQMIQSSSIIPQPSMRPRKESRLGGGRTETPVKLNRDNPDEKPPSAPTRRDAEPKTGDMELRDTPHPRVKSRLLSAGEERENAGDESRSDEP